MGRPLIIYTEAPDNLQENDTEDIAAFVDGRLGGNWEGTIVWDERSFDADVSDFGSVREAIDTNTGVTP